MTLTATPATGYSFVNWTEGGTQVSTSASYQFTLTGARTLVANFNANTYTVTLNTNNGTINSGEITSYTYGVGATLPTDVTRTGYTFGGWYDNANLTGTAVTSISTTATGDKTYWAKWNINSYAIAASANPSAGGTVSGAGNYNYGSSCTLTATPATGYNFTKWTKGGTQVSTNASYTFTVNAAGTYVAQFTKKTYAVTATANPTAGGTITGAGTYDHGTSVTLTATPATGYSFVNWTENGTEVSDDATYSFTAVGARTLVANFEENSSVNNHWSSITGTQYNLTMCGVIYIDNILQSSSMLEVGAFCGNECRGSARAQWFPPTGEYVVSLAVVSNQQSGEMITFRLYDHSTQQEFPSECVNSITFNSNDNIGSMGNWYPYAFFNAVAVTAMVTPEGAGMVEGTGDYLPGGSCTLTAMANEGYAFRSWSIGGEVVSTDNPYTFTVSTAVALTAAFDSQEVTSLAEGWTWWSTSIELSNMDGLTMLEEGLGHNGLMIKSINKFVSNYYPDTGYDYWFGQLTNADFNNESCYQINTSAACNVTMTGTYANPANHPIQLYSDWTWIGYPCGTEQAAATAFSGFTPMANDVLKDQFSFTVYYESFGWFPAYTMKPGTGYMYQSNATETRTLTFSNNGTKGTVASKAEDRYWKPNVNRYADNLSVIAVVTVDGEEQQDGNVELGAFVNGECRGSALLKRFEPTGRWYAMLSVSGMDGDQVEFALVDKRRAMTSRNSDKRIAFTRNAVLGNLDEPFVIDFGGLGSLGESMRIYPNPVERGDEFWLVLPEEETVKELIIVNALGEVVRHENGVRYTSKVGGLESSGVYTIKAVCTSGNVFLNKLIVK